MRWVIKVSDRPVAVVHSSHVPDLGDVISVGSDKYIVVSSFCPTRAPFPSENLDFALERELNVPSMVNDIVILHCSEV